MSLIFVDMTYARGEVSEDGNTGYKVGVTIAACSGASLLY